MSSTLPLQANRELVAVVAVVAVVADVAVVAAAVDRA
jgi:hypothetical protein